MNMDVIDQFVSQIQPELQTTGEVKLLTPQELHGMREELAALLSKLHTPLLTEEQRDLLSGKRTPQLQELLVRCGEGLTRRPELAKALGIDPALLVQLTRKDMLVGQVLKGAHDLWVRSGGAAAHVASQAEQLGERVLLKAKQQVQDPQAKEAEREQIGRTFCEAFRLHLEQRERPQRAAAQAVRRQRPLWQELELKQTELERHRKVNELLDGSREE